MSAIPLPTLKPDGKENLDALLHETVEKRLVPAVFYGATNAKETIYFNQEGEVVYGDPSKGTVNQETVTEIFSQSKLVTCVAALQLVEQGLVSLDSEEDIEKFLPEIGQVPLLEGYNDDDTPILVKPKNKVTLRLLMTHSSGFIYGHTPSILSKWVAQNTLPGLLSPTASVASLCTPLIFEPGTSWVYGHSIDWVGVLIERISGISLEDRFQKYIFEPIGVKSITFIPTDEVKSKKMAVCDPGADGKPVPTEDGFGMGRTSDANAVQGALKSGGGGLYGTQYDYLSFLRALLQCDPKSAHHSSKPLLSAESYAELFKPSIPRGPGYTGCDRIVDMVSRPAYIDPPATPETVNHSVGFLLTEEALTDRRNANSGCWSGAAKTQFWIDPTAGLAAICGTQFLNAPIGNWFPEYVKFEKLLYASLQ